MSSKTKVREITYSEAIQEAILQAMEKDHGVFVMGLGVTDYKGLFGTTREAFKRFGPKRVIETPACENALTGISIGAALGGKKPILIHARNDFMFLALDEMINAASKWKYMYAGKSKITFVVRGIIGKGWGQGPTHSQSIQSVFMHFPGLNVVMPSTPYDAKGFLLAALGSSVPCVILEHRRLYDSVGAVPRRAYRSKFREARVVCKGRDITIVSTSLMVQEAVKASYALKKMNISVEIIDPRTLMPLDEKTIIRSVKKTGRLIVADTSWTTCGFSSEVTAIVSEKALGSFKVPPRRIGLARCPAPVSQVLEEEFYPTYKTIFLECCDMLGKKPDMDLIRDPIIDNFKGPY